MSENQEPSFEELLKQSEERTVMRVSTGQKLKGTVVAISKDVVYIDIGMRSEASLPLNPEDERFNDMKDGDELDVFIAKPSGQVTVSLDPMMGYGDFTPIEKANEEGQPIEGKINKVIPGGYEVNVSGVRCFCPFSQLNLKPVGKPEDMVGETFEFKVIDLDIRSRNVVLSRRQLLEADLRKKLAATREKLVIGAVLDGHVTDIQTFGAFVDLGGIQGLLHVSQLSYQNVGRVEDVLGRGDKVTVKVLDITKDHRGKERISLSIKALLPNPWDTLNFNQGDLIEGTVVRKSRFGVFINLAPAVDGLLPRRMMKKAGRAVDMETFEEGQSIEVEVMEINGVDRKIALALPGWDEEIKSNLREGDTLVVEVIKVLPAGVLVQGVEDPAKGLIHKRTLKHAAMKQIMDDFPQGSKHEVFLDEVDSQGRFNFKMKTDEEGVDHATVAKFVSEGENLDHNPFATFFKKEDQ